MQLAPKNATWRPGMMRYLLNILQKENDTLGLAGRAMTALLLSGDTGLIYLLRQLLSSKQAHVRQLAALGFGILGDKKSVPELAGLLNDTSPDVVRMACLGLIAIGDKSAVDAVITVLLNGSEESRRIASEALVNHPKEGLALLKEGLAMDDLLVRRAVIYGLIRANNPELHDLLEKVAIEDSQWVVRNAAGQALEQMRLSNPLIPRVEPTLINQPWLINFAGKAGMGVGDTDQAITLLLQALERGEPTEKLKALDYLCQYNRQDAVPIMYNIYYGSQDQMREACFDALWHTASGGINLPPPAQFGLG
jgi:HEAT repeat protein